MHVVFPCVYCTPCVNLYNTNIMVYLLLVILYLYIFKVKFGIVDITTAEYEPSSFDVIYSRDTILHIEDKATLFANFLVSEQCYFYDGCWMMMMVVVMMMMMIMNRYMNII